MLGKADYFCECLDLGIRALLRIQQDITLIFSGDQIQRNGEGRHTGRWGRIYNMRKSARILDLVLGSSNAYNITKKMVLNHLAVLCFRGTVVVFTRLVMQAAGTKDCTSHGRALRLGAASRPIIQRGKHVIARIEVSELSPDATRNCPVVAIPRRQLCS